MSTVTTAVRPEVPTALRQTRVVAILRGHRPQDLPATVAALVAGGIRVLEVTLNSEGAFGAIERLAEKAGEHGIVVGAGTVLDRGDARRAIDAGAGFLVMPHTDADLIAWAAERGVPSLPGAATPTEVLTAWRAGACAVKAFPASVLGPRFVTELGGPLGEIPLVPVGGVTAENASAFIGAGALAVGVGSWLTRGADDAEVTMRAQQLVTATT